MFALDPGKPVILSNRVEAMDKDEYETEEEDWTFA